MSPLPPLQNQVGVSLWGSVEIVVIALFTFVREDNMFHADAT